MLDDDSQKRLRLYARREADEEVRDVFLIQEGSALALWPIFDENHQETALPLPPNALPAIFARYGKPLEPELDLPSLFTFGPDDAPLQLAIDASHTATLRRFRFMPFGWVYAADYLLWEPPLPGEPLAAPAPLVISALEALGRALMRKT
jgi:hypothetical protein